MKKLFECLLLLGCISTLVACSESVDVNGIKELADTVEKTSELLGSQELEQFSDTVGDAADLVGEVEKLTKQLKELPSEVNEEKVVSATITICYDGDTCKAIVNGKKESIRFLLIDSSEIKGSMPYAEEARDRLNELVEGKEIILELGKGDSRDKYDRLLSYVFLPTGESVQEILLEEGLATVRYIYDDQKYLDDYTAAMEQAENSKIGIWSIPGYAGYDQPFNVEAAK